MWHDEFLRPAQMLAGMRAALKPDGQPVLVEFRDGDESVPMKPEHRMSKVQINQEMNVNGLRSQPFVPILFHICTMAPNHCAELVRAAAKRTLNYVGGG